MIDYKEPVQISRELYKLVDEIAFALWVRTNPKNESDWGSMSLPTGVWRKYRGQAFALLDSLDLDEWQIRRVSHVEEPEASAADAEVSVGAAE